MRINAPDATQNSMLASYIHHDDTENYRAFSKGFDEYIKRSENEYEIKYVGSRPGEITEGPETNNQLVWYGTTESEEVKNLEAIGEYLDKLDMDFDMKDLLDEDNQKFPIILSTYSHKNMNFAMHVLSIDDWICMKILLIHGSYYVF